MSHLRSRLLSPLPLLLIAAALAASVESATHAQTLQLGDPAPPPAAQLTVCREQAQRLRVEATQRRSRAKPARAPEASVLLAQARWREVAAGLLDQPDPLAGADLVLRGWAICESAVAIDNAVQAAADSLTGVSGQEPPAASRTRLLEPLITALIQAEPDWLPPGAGAGERFARAEAMVAGDADLALLHDELIRLRDLAGRDESRLSANAALEACIGSIEIVGHLDQTPWLGTVWKQNRPQACGRMIQLLLHPSDGGAKIDARLALIDQCVQRMEALLGLGPTVRPRLDLYREALLRWMNDALLTQRQRPWPLLIDALDAMAERRRPHEAPAQRELRAASAALDRQCDAIESRMGELLASGTFEGPASDPNWATLIGQHRRNARLQQVLFELPEAIEWLAGYDRRATAAVWPRLLHEARQFDDPAARERFFQAAEPMVWFSTHHHNLPGEEDWRTNAASISDIVGDAGRGALTRLDSVRRARAAELIAGADESATVEELDAWRDLFRLVDLRGRLGSPDEIESAINRRGDVLLPAGFVESERRRLESAIRSALSVSLGGTTFLRAVQEALRQSAGAIIADALSKRPGAQTPGAPPALAPLLAASREAPGNGAIDPGDMRIMQWCGLQFEFARRSEADGPAPGDAAAYARHLGERIAQGQWRKTP